MAKKKGQTPKKNWVCTNCKHFAWDEKNGFWRCTGFGITTRVARPESIVSCSHRDAGEPFEQ